MNLSIIIPCFNSSTFLKEALDSLCSQRLDEVEFICVNDGSFDNTFDILNEYQRKDPRFKIIDKPNTGYGDSVNKGLDQAQGKYVAIFEPDDFIDSNMYEDLFHLAEENQLDVAKCCYYRYTEGLGDTFTSISKIPKNQVLCPSLNQNIFLEHPQIWNAIYLRNWLNSYGIRFLPTPGAAFQDTSFYFKTSLMARRFLCIDRAYYHYRLHSSNSVKSHKFPFAICDEFAECINFAKKVKKENFLKRWILEREFHTYIWNYYRISETDRTEFLKRWRNEWLILHKQRYTFRKKKLYLHLILLLTFPTVFRYYLDIRARNHTYQVKF